MEFSLNVDDCAICAHYLTSEYKTECCNQHIHRECLNKCLNMNNKCPFCRKVIINIQNIPENTNNIPELQNIQNIPENTQNIRVPVFKCTCCKAVICNVIFILLIVSWLLFYQIKANEILLRRISISTNNNTNNTNNTLL